MSKLLMPKATAVWLVENTILTFAQIAKFCDMHEREIKSIADGEVAAGVIGVSPIQTNQVTDEEIKRCEADPTAVMQMIDRKDLPEVAARTKGPRYTPMTKRTEKPNAIAWLVKTYPGMSDTSVGRLLATTKDTIKSIRERTHWNIANIKPENPVLLGLCSQRDLDAEIAKIKPSKMVQPEDANDQSDAFDSDMDEQESTTSGTNPFAAALAAYATAARQKVQPTSQDDEIDEDSDTQR